MKFLRVNFAMRFPFEGAGPRIGAVRPGRIESCGICTLALRVEHDDVKPSPNDTIARHLPGFARKFPPSGASSCDRLAA
jgi:hypothetical protein